MNLREENIKGISEKIFDVLIIGGGINGAVSAAALSARGAKVAIIDKGDFASFTSQNSSNLVWGGIKYLETFEFSLVRQLCLSRNKLIRSYPSSIKEIRFFTNLEKGFRFNRISLFLGATIYWAIGNFFTRPPKLLTKNIIKKTEPILNTEFSMGGFEYSDAFLYDGDARFVFNFIALAEKCEFIKKDNIYFAQNREYWFGGGAIIDNAQIRIFELYGVDNTSFLKEKVSSQGGIVAWMTLLAIAGFTPVPFKLLTITSGFVHFNLLYFIIVSFLTRGLRFFIIAFLIGNFGATMKKIIEKKLLTVSIIISIFLIIVAFLVYNFLVNFYN